MRIETPAEWWAAVDEFKDFLVTLVADYHPCGPRTGQPLPITALAAELACKVVEDQIKAEPDSGDPVDKFKAALEARDWELARRILSATWFGVPESRGAYGLPGFGVLCDLLSEDWVFDPEERP